MKPRFSKQMLKDFISDRVVEIEELHCLESYMANGTAQLRGERADVKRAVAYGEREALMLILQAFDL